jgi:hypothetical protein
MEIDPNASVRAHAMLCIGAARTDVWDVLTDVVRWPEWNPAVKDVVIDGPVAPGTVFRWRAGRARITFTIQEAWAPREFSWTGRMLRITAQHVWRLEEEAGVTLVMTAESWSGLAPRLFHVRFKRALQRALDKSLGYLDAEFGRRAIAEAAKEVERGRSAA